MTLAITYDKLRREIGRFLNYGRDPTAWTGDKAYMATDVADVLDGGLRRFYWPMLPVQKYKDGPVTQERYAWSFLSVNTELAVESGQARYELPEGFTDITSNGFSFAEGVNKPRIARIDDEALASIKSQSSREGDPQYYTIRAKATGVNGVTRYEVEFYPTPNADRTLTFDMAITPPTLSSDNQHPLGGAQHSETILEACLAEAEKTLDDTEGLHEKRFRELLAAAIENDRKLSIPEASEAWPLESPADGLKVNKAYLKRLIGDALFKKPHPATWSHAEGQQVLLALETGLRKFYSPPVLPGERYAHDWSFLKPVHYMTLQADKWQYDLPADFAMFRGDQILYEPGNAVLWAPIRLTSERNVQRRQEQTEATARPEIAAYRPKRTNGTTGTLYELVLFPTPDDDYEINFPYTINPSSLGDDAELPLGGQPNMQTVIEACLAAVEQIQGKLGVHSAAFVDCLRASVSHDRKAGSPDSLGFNRLPPESGIYDGFHSQHNCSDNITTYNGVEF